MAAHGFRLPRSTPIRYSQYQAAVREFDRDSLVELCARASMQMVYGVDLKKSNPVTPWSVVDIARVALAFGRPGGHTAAIVDVVRLCSMFNNLEAPADLTDPGEFTRHFSRTALLQFPAQVWTMPDFARTRILFGANPTVPEGRELKVMSGAWFQDVFGVTLDQYAAAVELAHAIATATRGFFDVTFLDNPHIESILAAIGKTEIRQASERHLIQHLDDFKAANRLSQRGRPEAMRPYSLSPLIDRPFVSGIFKYPIAPDAKAIMDKVSPLAVYYEAMHQFGTPFAIELGYVFEAYVGRQLAQITPAIIHSEIDYGPKKKRVKSSDWYVELDTYVLVFECKATRPPIDARFGDITMFDSLTSTIGKAINQLNRTEANIDQIAPLVGIPTSKPRVGIVLTLENLYLHEFWGVRRELPEAELPTAIVSVHELEDLVMCPPEEIEDAIRRALTAMPEKNTLPLMANVASRGNDNPIIQDAFDGFLFPQLLTATADVPNDAQATELASLREAAPPE